MQTFTVEETKMNKTSKVLGSLVLPGVVMVLAIGLLFAFSNLSLAQQGVGWPALPDSSTSSSGSSSSSSSSASSADASSAPSAEPSTASSGDGEDAEDAEDADDDGKGKGKGHKKGKGKGHEKGKGKGHEKHGD